mgnify:CR=1 FL=1
MNSWEESKHPRDADGKFTDKGQGTPAERKRLEEMGILSNKKVSFEEELKHEEVENSRVLKNPKEILEKKPKGTDVNIATSKQMKRLNELSNNEFSAAVADMNGELASSKTQDILLKEFLREKGYLGKPLVANKTLFNQLVENGAQVLYRGVPKENYNKELRDVNDVYIGRGRTTNGLWFSNDKNEAEGYAKGYNAVRVILHPKAKIAKISSLDIDNFRFDEEYEVAQLSVDRRFDMMSKGKAGAVSILYALKGYDAIDTGHNHVVILNRTALIMEGDDE